MSSCISSVISSRDPSPAGQKREVMDERMEVELLEVQIHKIVACMLRREVRNDLDTLRNYLARRFPLIRPELRDAIIMTTFKAAQRVAAAHADAILKETDPRTEWARRSLARWHYGLSVVEPAADYGIVDPRTEGGQLAKSSLDGQLPIDEDISIPIQQKMQEEELREQFDRNTATILTTDQVHPDTSVVPAVVDSRLEEVAAKLSRNYCSMLLVADPTVEPDDLIIPVVHIPDPEPAREKRDDAFVLVADFPADLSFNDLLDMPNSGVVLGVDLNKPLQRFHQ